MAQLHFFECTRWCRDCKIIVQFAFPFILQNRNERVRFGFLERVSTILLLPATYSLCSARNKQYKKKMEQKEQVRAPFFVSSSRLLATRDRNARHRSSGINIRDKFFTPSRIAFPGHAIKRLRRSETSTLRWKPGPKRLTSHHQT